MLPGINRPSRWPELSATRLRATFAACREWIEETVVDVSDAFDADDEVTYEALVVTRRPRRHWKRLI